MKNIKLIELAKEIQGNKNLKQKNIIRVIRAIPKVISSMLLEKKEVKFTPFLKLTFRIAKDRLVKSSITKEVLHMPQHLRFKTMFYNEFKRRINENENY